MNYEFQVIDTSKEIRGIFCRVSVNNIHLMFGTGWRAMGMLSARKIENSSISHAKASPAPCTGVKTWKNDNIKATVLFHHHILNTASDHFQESHRQCMPVLVFHS